MEKKEDNPSALWDDARRQLEQIEAARLKRTQRFSQCAAGPQIVFAGRVSVNFSSNNYLGLADHPRVVSAAAQALESFGAGAGGSRLITGSMVIHRQLENELARFKATEDALVFSSGYLANLGLLQTLGQRADGSHVPVFFDRLCHASIIDAVKLSGSKWRSFPHNDPGTLKRLLGSRTGAIAPSPSALVVTEGVFSMDGDLAPLPELLTICQQAGALLIVDDAHGTGTVGPGGQGTAAHFGVAGHPNLIQMGTLSKALGSMGGFAAAPRVLCELLINRARSFIFETALPPACAAAAMEALRMIQEDPSLPGKLQENAQLLREELARHGHATPDSPAPIIPLILGQENTALQVSGALQSQGFLVVAIRPPTVPRGTSRLRITPMATHSREEIVRLAGAIPSLIRAS